MKKFSEFKKTLTYTQILILSIFISILITLVVSSTIVALTSSYVQKNSINYTSAIIFYAVATFIFSFIFFYSKLGGPDKKYFDNMNRVKQTILSEYNLVKGTYTEVKFLFEKLLSDVDEDLTYVIIPILNNSNCRFFAKLIDGEEEDEIELIIKDIHDNTINTIIISNFIYFQKNFEMLN